MPADTIFAQFPGTTQHSLPDLSRQLFEAQLKHWPMLADGVAALQDVQTRTVDCGDFTARLQFNPKRIVSTAANVDAASIKERACFLCRRNLPNEQQGVLYKDSLLILCNPMPIFREHFTLSHIDHIPQSIEEKILLFLALAKDLSPAYSVFYNGPKCGASAPDHMHFQAAPAGMIPVEKEWSEHTAVKSTIGGVTVSTLERYGRSVIILEGKQEQEMELVFLRCAASMRRVLRTNEEPMMNVVGTFLHGKWRLIMFVRSKHRPERFFNDGDEKVMISPAAVDIGGLIVTPMERDFRRTDSALVRSIYQEVSVAQETIVRIIGSI